jgi:hypothetical protein
LLDYDSDGWLDLFVANDTEPNKLYHNNKNGTFTDEGIAAGVAFSAAGTARAEWASTLRTMMVPEDCVIIRASQTSMALYHNDGSGLFTDEAATPVSAMSAQSLTLRLFFDYDLMDCLISSLRGHVSTISR